MVDVSALAFGTALDTTTHATGEGLCCRSYEDVQEHPAICAVIGYMSMFSGALHIFVQGANDAAR